MAPMDRSPNKSVKLPPPAVEGKPPEGAVEEGLPVMSKIERAALRRMKEQSKVPPWAKISVRRIAVREAGWPWG